RQPHCWRFLFPLPEGADEPTADELKEKALSFIGEVDNVKAINKVIYRVHHRVATQWRQNRVFLMGDAAHLITPMWALGLNTGALDASKLPWRLAWYPRVWADASILDGYEREQKPLAVNGSGEMAEAARKSMEKRVDGVDAMSENNWQNAYTRTMLGVKLDVEGSTNWSMVARADRPASIAGDRLPDYLVHTPDGKQRRGSIVAFTSGLASAGWPGASAYAATKAAIIGLVKSAALELRTSGVRVNAISPGLVATPVFLESANEEELAMYEKSLGVSTPEEVVPSLLYLISDGSSTISGNVFERRLMPRG